MNERRKLGLHLLLTTLLLATPILAQEPLVLDDSCTVTVGNQTAEVLEDGSFVIENIAVFQSRLTGVAPQLYRVRATCLRHGQMVTGQSDFFELAPGQATFVADVFPAEIDPLPREILASAPSDTILPGQSLQLRVQAILPEGEQASPRRAEIAKAVRTVVVTKLVSLAGSQDASPAVRARAEIALEDLGERLEASEDPHERFLAGEIERYFGRPGPTVPGPPPAPEPPPGSPIGGF